MTSTTVVGIIIWLTGNKELKLDQARCSLAAKKALGAGSTEMKFNLVFADCMRSKGYDPI